MGQQVSHVYHLAPRNLRMAISCVFRDSVSGLANGLYPVDHRSQQHFVARERLFRIRSVPIDGFNQFDDIQ